MKHHSIHSILKKLLNLLKKRAQYEKGSAAEKSRPCLRLQEQMLRVYEKELIPYVRSLLEANNQAEINNIIQNLRENRYSYLERYEPFLRDAIAGLVNSALSRIRKEGYKLNHPYSVINDNNAAEYSDYLLGKIADILKLTETERRDAIKLWQSDLIHALRVLQDMHNIGLSPVETLDKLVLIEDKFIYQVAQAMRKGVKFREAVDDILLSLIGLAVAKVGVSTNIETIKPTEKSKDEVPLPFEKEKAVDPAQTIALYKSNQESQEFSTPPPLPLSDDQWQAYQIEYKEHEQFMVENDLPPLPVSHAEWRQYEKDYQPENAEPIHIFNAPPPPLGGNNIPNPAKCEGEGALISISSSIAPPL